MTPNLHALSNLEESAKTFKERNAKYGASYRRFGSVMNALFPEGVTISSPEQWNRFGIITQIVNKLTRYTADPMRGHLDSAHDSIVYNAMLEEIDAELEGMNVIRPIEETANVLDKALGRKE